MSLGFISTEKVTAEYTFTDVAPDTSGGQAVKIPLFDRTYNGREVWIEIATTGERRNAACELINRMYSWRGYGNNHKLIARATHTTFTISAGGEVFGTITLAADSDRGLAADGLFREEINAYRANPGAKACELTKLAFDATCESKRLLAALFHVVFIYGVWRHEGTDLFIEVNPRHRRFYEMMLGFKAIGDLRMNESVSAPAQLMHLSVANIRSKIDEHAGSAKPSRSLYPNFLSTLEEADARLHLWSAFEEAAKPAKASDDLIQITDKANIPTRTLPLYGLVSAKSASTN